MVPQALGYVGVRAKDLGDWASYGAGLLGLQRVDKSRSSMAFRMDDRKQRILVDADGGEGIGFYGWEMADAAALDALGAHLEKSEIKVARGSRALADERHVKDLIVLNDPLGNRLEMFHGAETASDPFKPGRSISGFRTGPLGLGHVVFNVDTPQTIDRLMAFYKDTLGFRLTDYYSHPFVARFLHLNPRHHSLAFIQTGKNAVHHIMMELFSFDDVGQGYDIALGEKDRVSVTLGRHTSDFITSFYSWTPSAFMVEYGWGARSIDVDTWQAFERKEGPSMWGHERVWLSEEDRAKARALRLKNAENGFRRPVQVIDGNYETHVRRLPMVGQPDEIAKGGALTPQRSFQGSEPMLQTKPRAEIAALDPDVYRLTVEVAAATRLLNMLGILDYSGHISARVPGEDALVIQGHTDSRAELTPERMLVVDFNGKVLHGPAKPPSEVPIHIEILKARPDVQAILHCHMKLAIAFTMMEGVTLQPMRSRSVRWESGVPIHPDPSHIKLTEQAAGARANARCAQRGADARPRHGAGRRIRAGDADRCRAFRGERRRADAGAAGRRQADAADARRDGPDQPPRNPRPSRPQAVEVLHRPRHRRRRAAARLAVRAVIVFHGRTHRR